MREHAKRYRAALSRKSPEEIAAMCAHEREIERKEQEALAEAEERKRFYNQLLPPDYDHYCKCATWTLEEAVALSFNKDPERISSRAIAPYVGVSQFARRYNQRWIQAQRAKSAGQLWDPVSPGIFIPWAINLGIELPAELLSMAMNRGIPLKDWQNLYEEAVENFREREEEFHAAIAQYQEALNAAYAENAQLKQRECAAERAPFIAEDEPTTATRNSMLKLIIGMAVRGYCYDPRQARNEATSDIRHDLEVLGIEMTSETILKYLKLGADLLRPGTLENAKPKPKSAKLSPKSP